MEILHYYHNKAILERILEFCGVPSRYFLKRFTNSTASLSNSEELKDALRFATNEYISAYGLRLLDLMQKDHASLKTFKLGWVLDNALDVHRSVWDRESIIGALDIEYFSKNFPGEPYLNPERTFELMEPVYQAIKGSLESYGISPLIVTTGQGYNFDMRIGKQNALSSEMVSLGRVEPTLQHIYEHPSPKRGRSVPEEDARAYDTMGKLMEFLCHRVFQSLKDNPSLAIPVVIGDIVCGNEMREAVSLDLSLYAHPIHKRSIRCPFSVYSKHIMKRNIVGDIVAERVGDIFCVPRLTGDAEFSLDGILSMRRSAEEAIRQAEGVGASIPDQSAGFANLLEDYKQSALHEFHEEYDAVAIDRISAWSREHQSFDPDSVPPCISQVFRNPNPLLLQPTNLQTVVRVLTALGLSPKHIAVIICSKYMQDFSWEVDFLRYDPNRLANVWVRILTGLILCGLDDLIDLNCVSQQEKGNAWMGTQYCPSPNCGFNLAEYRSMLQSTISL